MNVIKGLIILGFLFMCACSPKRPTPDRVEFYLENSDNIFTFVQDLSKEFPSDKKGRIRAEPANKKLIIEFINRSSDLSLKRLQENKFKGVKWKNMNNADQVSKLLSIKAETAEVQRVGGGAAFFEILLDDEFKILGWIKE